MGTGFSAPTHEALVRELSIVRSKGLTKLRGVALPALDACSQLLGESQEESSPAAVERVLRRAIDALGGGPYGEAAAALFGLAQGTRGLGPRERQEHAGDALGKTASTFRTKHQTPMVSAIADRILDLLHQASMVTATNLHDTPSLEQNENQETIRPDGADRPTVTERSASRAPLTVVVIDVVSVATVFDQAQERMVRLLLELVHDAVSQSALTCSVLPTGDGVIVLTETTSVSAGLEIALAVKDAIDERLLRLPIRVGIHTGEAAVIPLPDGSSAYVGTLLSLAQRLKDLGDDGHILLSTDVAGRLAQDKRFAHAVTRLASNPIEVKPGIELEVFSYFDGRHGSNADPSRAHRSSEVALAQLGRRAAWDELFAGPGTLKVIDLSLPMLGIPALIDHLEERIHLGDLTVQILLMHPGCPAALRRAASVAYKSEDELQTTIEYVLKILMGLRFSLTRYGQDALARFDVRLYDSMPSFCGIIGVNRAFISMYMEHLTGSRGPYFEFTRDPRLADTSLVAAFDASFDDLWQRSESIFSGGFLDRQRAHLDRYREEAARLRVPPYMEDMFS